MRGIHRYLTNRNPANGSRRTIRNGLVDGSRSCGRHALAVSLATAACSVTAAPASADLPSPVLPPTLAGETFTQTANDRSFALGCGTNLGDFTYSGSLTFTASGVASGPYTGTYTETGTLTANGSSGSTWAERTAYGSVTSFSSTFTITATDGSTVKGSKTLDVASPSSCYYYPGPGGEQFSDSALLTYAAQITTRRGTYEDAGTSSATFDASPRWETSSFNEAFTASTALRPTDANQCMSGGWARFGVFNNEGVCLAFVEAGGRIPGDG